jgi:hypothetical protein
MPRSKKQLRKVIFLGAGASKGFGYPITREILPEIRARLNAKNLFPVETNPKRERAKMRRLTDYLGTLFPAFFEEHTVLPLVTDVLSLIDHLLAADETAIPKWTTRELQDCRKLLEQATIETVQPKDASSRRHDTLDRFTDWVLCEKEASGSPLTIISTNYDNLVEALLFEKIEADPVLEIGNVVDMGFSWREHTSGTFKESVNHPPPDPWVRLLKLHGSMSWVRCPLCGFLYVNTVGEIYQQAYRGDMVDYNNTCICGHGPIQSVIVAPSMVRLVEDPDLKTIWRSALEALRIADEWVIAGYSLPSEDIAIRSILVRAFHSRGKKRKAPAVHVVQLGEDVEIEGRYRLLFPDCTFEGDGFLAYLEKLPKAARHYPTF